MIVNFYDYESQAYELLYATWYGYCSFLVSEKGRSDSTPSPLSHTMFRGQVLGLSVPGAWWCLSYTKETKKWMEPSVNDAYSLASAMQR